MILIHKKQRIFILYILIHALLYVETNCYYTHKHIKFFSNINRFKLNINLPHIDETETSLLLSESLDIDNDISNKSIESESKSSMNENALKEVSLKMITFNILAPCYKKIMTIDMKSQFESENKDLYMERNLNICMELLQTDADIICLQEFWSGSNDLQQLYIDYLCKSNHYNKHQPYSLRTLSRTSHWRSRGDSVAIFVKSTRIEIEDVQEILFHDCGDRVALMLLLALHPYPIIHNDNNIINDDNSNTMVSMNVNNTSSNDVALSSSTSITTSSRSILSNKDLEPKLSSLTISQNEQYCNRNSSHTIPIQRFICVNTHLLFPHNSYSSQIRLREITKVLGFIEAYKQKELCASICSRSDVQIPVIIAGDFNGSPRGSVYKYIRSQNFRSSMEEYHKDMQANCNIITTEVNNDDIDESIIYSSNVLNESEERSFYYTTNENNTLISNIPQISAIPIEFNANNEAINENPYMKYTTNKPSLFKWNNWISHKSHLNKNVAVDHIFYLNPSEQVSGKLPPLPDWTNLVWNELLQKIVSDKGVANTQDIFTSFDVDGSSYVTTEEFTNALQLLGFVGENTPCLTSEEIEMLVLSADKNNDGLIDYKEFYERFWLASIVQTNDFTNNTTNTTTATTTKSNDENNNKRLLFARSKWLTENYVPNTVINNMSNDNNIDSKPLQSNKNRETIVSLDTGDEIILLEPFLNFDNIKFLSNNNSNTIMNNNTINNTIMNNDTNNNTIMNNNDDKILSSQIIKSAYSFNNRINVVPLGELSIQSVRIYPEEMEYGIWPKNYTLSDHGMIECIFRAKLNF